jgi:hypothetical protein
MLKFMLNSSSSSHSSLHLTRIVHEYVQLAVLLLEPALKGCH